MTVRKHSPLRITLRALLVITTFTAVFFAWEVRKWHNRKAVAEAVRRNNGLAHDKAVGPAWLRNLVDDEGAFSQVRSIEFGPGFAGFDPENPIGDVQLRDALSLIPAGTPLEYLGLSHAVVTDRSAPLIAGLEIQHLNLDNASGITDESLRRIAEITSLTKLNLEGTSVTDTGLSQLSSLQKLEEIDLGRTAVGDAGLVHLSGLLRLRELVLDGTRITDNGLEALRQLDQLRVIAVRGTSVTAEGVTQWRRSMPRCVIASDH
ncbi:MAG: hypothetical protein AAGA03_02830 [Planctomycetota bacterium]